MIGSPTQIPVPAFLTKTKEDLTGSEKQDTVVPQADNPLTVQVAGDHYKKLAIQPVEYIHANNLGYFEGNVIKYVTRWKDKNGIVDLAKAKHYIELLIELETKGKEM